MDVCLSLYVTTSILQCLQQRRNNFQKPKCLFYVTSHGFGHIFRSLNVIKNSSNLFDFEVVSTLPPEIIHREIGYEIPIHARCLDSGAKQDGPLTTDPLATLESYYSTIYQHRAELIYEEKKFLEGSNVDIIFSDSVGLVHKIAQECGIYSVLMTNLFWDSLYDKLLEFVIDDLDDTPVTPQRLEAFRTMISTLNEDYNCADMLLAYPGFMNYHENFPLIETIIPLPFVSRYAQTQPLVMKSLFHAPSHRNTALVQFGGISSALSLPFDHVDTGDDWHFIVLGDFSSFPHPYENNDKVTFLSNQAFVPDIVNAVDVVIGKLGYGSVSECVANNTPMVFVPREFWPEEPYMRATIEQEGMGVCLPKSHFLKGKWRDALERAIGRERTGCDEFVTPPPLIVDNYSREYLSKLIKNRDFGGIVSKFALQLFEEARRNMKK